MFKKVFAAMLAGLFISAPAFAEVKMSGSYFLQGNAKQSAVKDVDTYRYYESDLEIKTQITVDENTAINITAEAFDTNWTDYGNLDDNTTNKDAQNYFELSKATLTHKFTTGTTFLGGADAKADSWGSAFGDDASRIYFISADQALPFGTLTVQTEKFTEGKNGIYDDSLDVDGYLLGLSLNVGGFDIKPAIYYKNDKTTAQHTNDSKIMVAATGKVGAISIESEFGFANDEQFETDTVNDYNVFGFWADAAADVANFTINTGLLYSSNDDAVSYVVGDELCPMEILGDEVLLDGTTLFRVKAATAITEKVDVNVAAAYVFTNKDDKDISPSFGWKDNKTIEGADLFDSAYELDANASYKATDAVTLSCGVAYLDGDTFYKQNDGSYKSGSFPQARIDAYAKINVAF